LTVSTNEVSPGVWELHGLYCEEEIIEQIRAAESVERWETAYVGQYNNDTGSVDGIIIDTTHRHASVINSEHISNECKVFEAKLRNTCLPIIREVWGLDHLQIEGPQFVRYPTGGRFNLHRDWGRAFPNRCVSVILYLNDDFVGGELYFSEIEFVYRPRRGACVFFPSEYLHASLPISEGQKSILVTFLCSICSRPP
jgi:Rps23 Pro-64 3,4-dihydroxylase Tpa1-like proline 4-hydroxylase